MHLGFYALRVLCIEGLGFRVRYGQNYLSIP